MICAQHNWWSTDPCPRCDPAALVTAAETKTDLVSDEDVRGTGPAPIVTAAETKTDLVSPDAAAGGSNTNFDALFGGTVLDIPPFLERNRDGTFAHPELLGEGGCFDWTPNADRCPEHRDWSQETDQVLLDNLNSPDLSLTDRQPIYQELHKREDKKKALARIADMKAKKAAKAAEETK